MVARVETALGSARAFARAFDPELVIIFGPDHYNGFFYDMMPPFCIGAAATSVGDYGLPPGPLPVDGDAFLMAVAIGASTGFIGAYVSYFLDGATGGVIVTLQTAIFLLFFVFAPKHGLLAARRKAAEALRRDAGGWKAAP